jgi:hypothetical protein
MMSHSQALSKVKMHSICKSLVMWFLGISCITALGGCAGHIYEWEAQTRSLPISPAISSLSLTQEPVAVLSALTPLGHRGLQQGVSFAFDRALSKATPPITTIPSHQVLSQLNAKGLTADYAELVAVYERTGILDRPRLERIGSACSVHYVFQPVFSSFGQEMENRFALLGWRLLQTRITVLRLALQLWDVRTGTVVWASSGEVTLASDVLGQARIPLDRAAEILWFAMFQDFENGRTESTYTHLTKVFAPMNPFKDDGQPAISDTVPPQNGAVK